MRLLLMLLIAFLVSCTTHSGNQKTHPAQSIGPQDVFYYDFNNREIRYIHAIPSTNQNLVFKLVSAPYPEKMPGQDTIFRKAQQFYGEQKFKDAANLLMDHAVTEKTNLLYQELLARSIYWIPDRNQQLTFDLYRYIIATLDRKLGTNDKTIWLDLWFGDVYWKLATLYMDYEQWWKAAYELCRAMHCGLINYPRAYSQALVYLAKCYYKLGNYPAVVYLQLYHNSLFKESREIGMYLDAMKRR